MTRTEHQPIDYDVLKDMRQPPRLKGVGIVIALVAGLVSVSLIGSGVGMAVNTSPTLPPPTLITVGDEAPTSASSPTPTLDYCWWLTPTPTPTPTLMYTPDAWGLQGTAIYFATNPPQTPTPPPPRELCIEYATFTPETTPTATLTPLALPGLNLPEITEEPARQVSPTIELPFIVAPPTWTPSPMPPAGSNPPAQPQIVVQTVIVPVDPVIYITQAPPQVIVVTATATNTLILTDTGTYTPTSTDTPTPTATHTASPTMTDTGTYTPTSTDTPTPTATCTLTPTPTPTLFIEGLLTDTPTPTPTLIPSC